MESTKQIIAIASRYGIVVQHTFPDLYSAIFFLKKGAKEGIHLALGAFDPSSGTVYVLDNHKGSSSQPLSSSLESFVDLGLKASNVQIY